ncbi:MAG: UbiD family decarboxylase [Clostridiaceae bacterium]|nr:UbiD family decarboxylase [Clostridiaceae bacterium]
MIKDLRDYLNMLEDQEWIDIINEPVELLGIPAVMKEQEEKGRAVLFKNITGYDYSLVNNLFGSRQFLAEVFGCTIDEVVKVFAERYAGRIKPKMVEDAPVHQVILQGDDIDVEKFPFIVHGAKDGGRYITAGIVIAKDPETGVRNCSINRMQLKGPNKTGLRMSPTQDLESYYKKAQKRNMNLEIAVSIGNHPLDLLAAACGPPREVDEFDIAGSLRGEPVELVKCVTVDLEVPARAEVVIEGYLAPNELEPEGPFGDFMEFYIPVMDNHVFHITAITMRNDPIVQAISAGSKDDVTLLATPREAQLYKVFKEMNVDVKGINLAICNNYLTGAVSIRKQLEFEPKNIMMAAFGSFKFLKNFIVVDHDVDVYNPKDIFWALSTRLRAEQGVLIVPNAVGFGRDVHGIHTTKMGIDATAPLNCWDEFERVTIPGG